MHTFTFIAALDVASRDTLASFADACADYAKNNKPGLPRGLQTGSAAVTVAIVEDPSEDALLGLVGTQVAVCERVVPGTG